MKSTKKKIVEQLLNPFFLGYIHDGRFCSRATFSHSRFAHFSTHNDICVSQITTQCEQYAEIFMERARLFLCGSFIDVDAGGFFLSFFFILQLVNLCLFRWFSLHQICYACYAMLYVYITHKTS